MVFQNDIIAGAAGAGGGYTIDQSIRFNDNDSAYLSRTFGTPTDATNWTFSAWIKRCNLGTEQWFFNSGASAAAYYIRFESTDKIRFRASTSWDITTTQVFRDVSAWYHIVATFANGAVTLYVNNESIGTASVSDTTYNFFTNIIHSIGGSTTGGSNSDLYLAETHGIDGQALSPTNFAEYNDDGVWIPKAYAGTYGNNGFYITGADSANLGADESGNGNDFTSSGLTSDDQVTDTPTDNYATLNPLDRRATTYTTVGVSNGNLELDYKIGNAARSAFGDTLGGGKWVFEATLLTAVGGSAYVGWSAANVDLNNLTTQGPNVFYSSNGNKYVSSTSGTGAPTVSSYGASYTNGDVIRVETDFTASTIEFFKNGTSQGSISISGLNDGTRDYFPSVYGNNAKWGVNFGQQPFIGTPTAGYKALSTANLPIPTIADGSAYFQTTLFTGTGAELEVNQIENSTFQPDVVWIKQRNKTDNHVLTDAVRGAPLALYPNGTSSELIGTGGITGLDPDGFTLSGDGNVWNNVNQSGITAAAWQWLAANGTASNSDGSITSTVSANTTAGFSVVTYTGTGSAATVGHGLGAEPQFIAIKGRTNVDSWGVYPGTSTGYGGQYRLKLNETSSVAASSVYWNNTDATSSVFTVNTDAQVNGSGVDYVAYCWAEVEGYSKIGKYTGNGSSEGPFVWCGFRPSFLLIKKTTATDSWEIFDSERPGYNETDLGLYADTNGTELTGHDMDLLSNGFKVRNANGTTNTNGATHIFMAFAEHPFGGDGVAPVPAR